jgi:hypothetical protein
LTYTGAPLSGQQGISPGYITGQIVLAAPLNPNEANQIVTPLSWGFSTPVLNSGLDTPYGGPSASFDFSTVNGQIVGWTVIANSNSPAADGYIQSFIDLTNAGDTFVGTDSQLGYCPQCYQVTATSSTAGIWVDGTAAAAPEIDPGSALGGLTLLLGGLAVMRGRRSDAPI